MLPHNLMSSPAPLPSFDRAVYAGDPPAADQCAYCHRAIAGEYFRVGGHMACSPCAQQAQSLIPPDSHRAYMRALLFGAGAALLACAGYSVIRMMGFMIGFVAIGVGWAIGKAMKSGSGGLGGRRYQITAMVLTYAAISLSFIPVAIKAAVTQRDHQKAAVTQSSDSGTDDAADSAPQSRHAPASTAQFALGLAMICGLGLISPFLMFSYSMGQALFGLLFLYLGMQAAWKLTQKANVEIDGPFGASGTDLWPS